MLDTRVPAKGTATRQANADSIGIQQRSLTL
jgi:hypothetical protein